MRRIHGTGIFTYIYHENQPNVGEYTIHASYGYGTLYIYIYSLGVQKRPLNSHSLLEVRPLFSVGIYFINISRGLFV